MATSRLNSVSNLGKPYYIEKSNPKTEQKSFKDEKELKESSESSRKLNIITEDSLKIRINF